MINNTPDLTKLFLFFNLLIYLHFCHILVVIIDILESLSYTYHHFNILESLSYTCRHFNIPESLSYTCRHFNMPKSLSYTCHQSILQVATFYKQHRIYVNYYTAIPTCFTQFNLLPTMYTSTLCICLSHHIVLFPMKIQ